MSVVAVIKIGIDPTIELGPLSLAWHGLTLAFGILLGAWIAGRVAREYGFGGEPMSVIAVLAALGGILGGRVLYLAEEGDLASPGEWLGTKGFSFNGGLVAAAVVIAIYVRRTQLPLRYLDACAVGLPLGVALGRVGDVINGEHYGPRSDSFLAVQNTHPDALVPRGDVAYHSGGLYDLLLGVAVFAIVWPLRHHLRRPTELVWLVILLLGIGRFIEFFFRSDSESVGLGLTSAQWTSLAMAGAGLVGLGTVRRRRHIIRRMNSRG